MEVNKRDFLKQLSVGVLSAGSFTTITTGEGGIDKFAVETAKNEEKEMLAFTSVKENTLCLYVATGTTDVDTPAKDLVQLSKPRDGSVMNVRWTGESIVRYWQNSAIRELTLGADGSIIDKEKFNQIIKDLEKRI